MSFETYGDIYAQAQEEAEQEALMSPSFPELRSVWQHKNGNHYIVEEISNRESERQEKYPTTVIYRNVRNGALYSRPLSRLHGSMTLVEKAQPAVDQIEAEVEKLLSKDAIAASGFAGTDRFFYIAKQAAFIARGAAFRSYRDALDQRESARPPSGGYLALSDDEIALIESLRKPGSIYLAPAVHVDGSDPLMGYLERQWEWSMRTFGPGLRSAGILNHIRKELGEVEKEPFDLMEWVDIMILALDGYWRHGGSALRLLTLLQFKQDKNFARQWPDWRERSEDQPIEHDRTDEAALVSAIDAL